MTKEKLKKCLEVCKDGCSHNCPLFDGDFDDGSNCIDCVVINCYRYLKDEDSVNESLTCCTSQEEKECKDHCPMFKSYEEDCLKVLFTKCLELL